MKTNYSWHTECWMHCSKKVWMLITKTKHGLKKTSNVCIITEILANILLTFTFYSFQVKQQVLCTS